MFKLSFTAFINRLNNNRIAVTAGTAAADLERALTLYCIRSRLVCDKRSGDVNVSISRPSNRCAIGVAENAEHENARHENDEPNSLIAGWGGPGIDATKKPPSTAERHLSIDIQSNYVLGVGLSESR